ncbi:hypothetical protein CSUI_007057 [Cystoisospora suis]|uniref:Regulator of chromosome condensation repeat-containing protein n=1 Tax=Cystoisospora suis TaxID=483139 RepID=A0A2C6KRW6_9APIC|nr:hypothetical protein CSUI_007057 [Cystoisospora suis]
MRGQVTKIATGGWDCEGISFLQTPKDYNLALTDSGDLYAWGPGLRHALPHWSYENLKQDKHLSYKKREKEEEEVKGRDSPFDLERKKGMEQVKSGEREEKDENEEEEEKKKKRKRFFSSIEDEAEERKKEKEEETQRQETFFTERRDFGRHPMKIRKEKLFLKRRGKEEEKEEGRDESWNPEDLLIRDVACGPLGVLLLVEKKNLP